MNVEMVGGLMVQLAADVTKLRADMDQATTVVKNSALEIDKAFSYVKTGLVALVGVGSVAAFAGMIKSSIEGSAALHDMAAKTGATVEALSALISVGKLSDTSAQTITSAMNKLSRGMSSANEEGKGVGQALKALNIDFDSFSKLKPEQQMQEVAKAMSQFGDGTGKTAAAMALYGKSGAELLPFLKDLADEGKLQAKVTAEQAAMADNFSDNLVKLKGSSEAWKKQLSLGLLPALNDMSTVFVEMFTKSGGLKDKIKELADDGTLANWARNSMAAISYLVDVAQGLYNVLKIIGTTMAGTVAAAVTSFGSIGTGIKLLIEGEYSQAFDTFKNGARETRAILSETGKDVADIWGSKLVGQSFRDSMDALKKAGNAAAAVKPQVDMRAALEGNGDAAKKAKDAYDAMIKKLAEHISQQELEIQTGTKLTEGQKMVSDMLVSVRDGLVKLTPAQAESLGKTMQQILANEKYLKTLEEEKKWLDESGKANERKADQVAAETAKIAEQVKQQEEANSAVGASAQAVQALEIAKLEEMAVSAQRKANQLYEARMELDTAAAYQEQADGLRRLIDLKKQNIDLKTAQSEIDAWKQIGTEVYNGLTDSLYRAFEKGESFLGTFISSIRNMLKTAALKMGIQVVLNSAGQLVAGALGGGSSYNGYLSAASNGITVGSAAMGAYNVAAGYLGYGGATAGAASGTLGYANAVGAMGGDSLGALIASNSGWAGVSTAPAATSIAGATTSEGLAAGAASAGAGSASSLAATLGPYAIVALALLAIFGDFSKFSLGTVAEGKFVGGKLKEAMYSGQVTEYGLSNLEFGNNPEHARGGALQNAVDQYGNAISTTASFLGGSVGDNLGLSIATDLDREGKMAAIVRLMGANGDILSGTQTGAGAFTGTPTEAASKMAAEDVAKWFAENVPVVVVQALQKSDLPQRFQDFFNTVAPDALTTEKATKMLEVANAVQTLTNNFTPLGGVFTQFGTLTVDTMQKVAALTGGFDALSQAIGSYYSNFYSQEEQTALAFKSIEKALSDVGLTVPKTRDEFRALVDAQNLNTDAGQKAFAVLMNVQAAFAALVPAATQAADSIKTVTETVTTAATTTSQAADTAAKAATGRSYWAQQASNYQDQRWSLDTQKQFLKDLETKGSAVWNYIQKQGIDAALAPTDAGWTFAGDKAITGPTTGALQNWYMMQAAKTADANIMTNQGWNSWNNGQNAVASGQLTSTQQQQLDLQKQQNDLLQTQIKGAEQLITALNNLRSSFTEYLQNLRQGDLSALSPQQKYDESMATFESLAKQALDYNDTAAAGQLQAAADQFLRNSATYNGVSQHALNFDKVVNVMEKVLDKLGTLTEKAQDNLDILQAGFTDNGGKLETANALAAKKAAAAEQAAQRSVL